MSLFKVSSYQSPLLNTTFDKVVRPIVYSVDGSGFKISNTVLAYVSYNFNFSAVSFSEIDARIYLETSSDNVIWVTLNQNILNTQTGSTPSLGLITLTGLIPIGNFVRLRGQVEPDSSITYLDGTEYLLFLS